MGVSPVRTSASDRPLKRQTHGRDAHATKMTTVDANIVTLTTRREALVGRLTVFRRHVLRHLLFAGAARVIAELVLACVLSLLLDRWLRLSLPMRVIFLILMACGVVYELWKRILAPLQ